MSASIAGMCSVARGSCVGGRQPSHATSCWKARISRSASAAAVMPSSFARRMILSSMSVKLRTKVTSSPRARR